MLFSCSKKVHNLGAADKSSGGHRLNVLKVATGWHAGNLLRPVDAEDGVDRRRDIFGVDGPLSGPVQARNFTGRLISCAETAKK